MSLMRILSVLILLLPVLSFAQVNIEKQREKKAKPIVGQLRISRSSTRGNVNVTQLSTSGRLDYTQGPVHTFLIGSYLSSEDGQSQIQQEGFGHIRFTYMPSLIGIDVFSQAEYNPFKALSIRQLNGAYARIEPLSDETLSIGLGCMMDYEKLSKGQSDGLVARGTSYVSYFYEKDIYTLSVTGYYQPKLSDLSDYRLTAEVSAEIKLSTLISIIEQFTYMYDSSPPASILVDDRRNTTSIKIGW